MKRRLLAPVLALGLLFCTLSACGGPKVPANLILPATESVYSVLVLGNGSPQEHVDLDWISQVMTALAAAPSTGEAAADGIPDVESYIQLDISADETTSVFLYQQDDGYYVSQAAGGVYQVDEAFYTLVTTPEV